MRQSISVLIIGVLALALTSLAGCDVGTKPGVQLVLQAQPQGDQAVSKAQLEAVRKIVEDRARNLGASDPVVRVEGADRISVELPGVTDLEEAKKTIAQTGLLEFIDGGDSQLSEGQFVCTTLGCPRPEQLQIANPVTPMPVPTNIPVATLNAAITGTIIVRTPAGVPVLMPTPSKTWNVVIAGNDIDGGKTKVVFDQAGLPQVSLEFTSAGTKKIADFTSKNVGKYMPIVLDKKVISSPVIQGAIAGGSAEINNISPSDARRLSAQQKSGALPVNLKILEAREK